MYYAVRVPEYAWPIHYHVESGQAVVPGSPIVDVTLADGVVRTLTSEFHGVVASVEDSDWLCKPGDKLCHIISRGDHSSRKTGLVPKPSTYQRFLRFGR